MDEDFLIAMEQGFRRAVAWAWGIDRLLMVLTGQALRETIPGSCWSSAWADLSRGRALASFIMTRPGPSRAWASPRSDGAVSDMRV